MIEPAQPLPDSSAVRIVIRSNIIAIIFEIPSKEVGAAGLQFPYSALLQPLLILLERFTPYA